MHSKCKSEVGEKAFLWLRKNSSVWLASGELESGVQLVTTRLFLIMNKERLTVMIRELQSIELYKKKKEKRISLLVDQKDLIITINLKNIFPSTLTEMTFLTHVDTLSH